MCSGPDSLKFSVSIPFISRRISLDGVSADTFQANTNCVRDFKSKEFCGSVVKWLRHYAQAGSRRLHTAAARVQSRVWSCGIL
jgi:hypothetical protein